VSGVYVSGVVVWYLGVGADGERVAGGRGGGELCAHARRGRGQVPDGQVGRLAADDQRAPIRQQLHRPYVVVALLQPTIRSLTNLPPTLIPLSGVGITCFSSCCDKDSAIIFTTSRLPDVNPP
jgi:hypothetical protein